MIELIFVLLGFIVFFLDIAMIPALTSHLILSDILLFYSLSLYSIKKEKSLILIIFLLWMKMVWIPVELILPYLSLFLVAFLTFVGILNTAKISIFLASGLSGFIVFTLEFLLFKKTFSLLYVNSLLIQILLWICLVPILSILDHYYKEKIKGKGVFV